MAVAGRLTPNYCIHCDCVYWNPRHFEVAHPKGLETPVKTSRSRYYRLYPEELDRLRGHK